MGDILEAPFPPESFDVITCFDVLEHLYEPRQVMTQGGKWLKPGGIFYVLVPNIDSAEARVFSDPIGMAWSCRATCSTTRRRRSVTSPSRWDSRRFRW